MEVAYGTFTTPAPAVSPYQQWWPDKIGFSVFKTASVPQKQTTCTWMGCPTSSNQQHLSNKHFFSEVIQKHWDFLSSPNSVQLHSCYNIEERIGGGGDEKNISGYMGSPIAGTLGKYFICLAGKFGQQLRKLETDQENSFLKMTLWYITRNKWGKSTVSFKIVSENYSKYSLSCHFRRVRTCVPAKVPPSQPEPHGLLYLVGQCGNPEHQNPIHKTSIKQCNVSSMKAFYAFILFQ